jgi:hypothetical protein
LSIFLVVTRKRNQAFVAFTWLTPHLLILNGRARKDTRGVHKTSLHYLFIHRTQRVETQEIAGKMSDGVQHLALSLSAIKGISNTALITLAVPHLGGYCYTL